MARSRSRRFADLIGKDAIVDSSNDLVGGGAVTTYSSIDALPLSGNAAGDQAFVSENNRLYIWTGDGWYNIALVNTDPSIQANSYSSSYELSTEGTATTVTLIASDPEGVPITWTYANSGLGSIATISQSNNVFTITPTSNVELGGTFSVTFKASDGVNLATATSEFTLEFITTVEDSKYTSLLLTSVGSNGGKNSTATDSSTNNHTLTLNGGAKLESFSPYRSGGYSYYFDGSGDTLTVDDPFAFGTSDFTVEFWYNPSVQYSSSSTARLLGGEVSGSGATWGVRFSTYNGTNGMIFGVGTYGSNTGGRYVNGYWGTKGQWDHIVWQRNSGTIECYINGVSQTLTTMQQNFTWSDGININGTKNLTVGSRGSDEYFTGYIKELKITNGSALYTSGVTVPTEAISVGSADFLGLHLPYLKDASSNDHSITVAGNVSAKPFGPYDYNEYDSATHGGSVYFDGTDDNLTLGSSSGFAFGTGDYTIDFWIYATNEDNVFICDWRGGSSGGGGLHLTTGGYDGSLSGAIRLSGDAGALTTTKVIDDSQWHHVAIVRSSGTTTIYIDGKSNVSQSDTINYTKEGINFCKNSYNSSGYLNAYLSDFRIVKGTAVYTADFTPPTEPVTAITNTSLLISSTDASIVDKSQTQSLTLVGDTQSSTSQTKYGSSSMYFDGSGDYIRADAALEGITSSTPFTIEAWVYPISSLGGTSTDSIDFIGINTLASGANTLTIGNKIVRKDGTTYNPTDLSLDQWHHIAYVYDGSNSKYYINGSLNITISGTVSNLEDCSLLIGAEADAANAGSLGNYFNGYIEDVRITKGLARYTANFTPPTASLEG